ncbi:MAG: rhamnulokinase, partial [Clostridia bacterium]|nr:rhamnulokinase [Clostridia bacterium]
MQYFLAVDIGASSGRHILSHLQDGKLVLEEIHRFENGFEKKNGHLCWDIDHLFDEIVAGMKKCGEIGKIPASVGIDTWGVDFVLLDKDGNRLGDAVSYRDARTDGMDAVVENIIPLAALYKRTGIQKQLFNTIYQLMSVKQETPALLEQADTLLFVPEYLTYRLSGQKVSEYT